MRMGRFVFTPCLRGKGKGSQRKGSLRTGGSCSWQENSVQTDYREYSLNVREWLQSLAIAAVSAGLAAYTFYRSMAMFLILLVPAAFLPRYMKRYWRERRQRQLEAQFKEAVQMLSAALSAGFSVENAIGSCLKELELMYGPDGMMTREFACMVQQMNMNRPVEELMSDFARRSGDSIRSCRRNFARIFQAAKRSGGQLVPVIRRTVQVMEDRFQVKEEIQTLTAARRYEQRVMNVMPFLMILYIDGTSPGFFSVMYTTLTGRLVMTGCLALYALACWLSWKILDIQAG